MKLFFNYLRQFRSNFICFAVFSVVFAGVLFLYNSNAEAVLYAALICGVIGLVFIAAGFVRFYRKHRLLNEIYEYLPLKTDRLSQEFTPTELDYQKIITKLSEINSENISRLNNLNRENIDYFTVWVHQIKTPISAMQLLLQGEDSELSRELSAELFRVEQYAEMALNFVRLDSSSNDFVISEYQLDDIIRQAVRRYAPLFVRRKIRLEFTPTAAAVLTDEKWLLFIIEQLLSNAVKYTYKGSVSVAFSGGILTVSDSGIGISAEDLPRIFEKGYTGLSGRTENKSTGLGLYLCKKAADKLGHKISVKSAVGQGTCFSVDLSRKPLEIE